MILGGDMLLKGLFGVCALTLGVLLTIWTHIAYYRNKRLKSEHELAKWKSKHPDYENLDIDWTNKNAHKYENGTVSYQWTHHD